MRITRLQIDMLAAVIAETQASERPADGLLHQFFRANPQLGARDRSVVAEGLFGYLRRKRSLETTADTHSPLLLALATLAKDGHSIRELSPLLSDRESGWLEQLKAKRVELSPAIAHDVPDWLWDRLGAEYSDEERDAMTRAWLQPAPLDIRINPLQTTREEAQKKLAAAGIDARPTPLSPYGLRVDGRPALNRVEAFIKGDIEVQDEGSQLLAMLVAPTRNEMVVDFCAGAGGKTLALAMTMQNQGHIVACDVSAPRLEGAVKRLRRAGVHNVEQYLIEATGKWAKRRAGSFDRVLVDAPCTGTGTWRRNPDARLRLVPNDLAELVVKQAGILRRAAELVKIGGRLVYATCSLLLEENDKQVASFLSDNPNFRAVPLRDAWPEAPDTGDVLRLTPRLHGTDGFYGAVLERIG